MPVSPQTATNALLRNRWTRETTGNKRNLTELIPYQGKESPSVLTREIYRHYS